MADWCFTVSFDGRAGDARDELLHDIIDACGGVVTASGTFLVSDPPVRDLDYSIEPDRAHRLRELLIQAGFNPQRRA